MANDLKSGLLISQLQQYAWWGAYEFLNNLDEPSTEAIRNMQISKLSIYELSALKNCKEANKFLQSLKNLNIGSLAGEVKNAEDDAIGKALMKLANAALAKIGEKTYIIKGHDKDDNFIVDFKKISENLEELEHIMRSATTGLGRAISEEKLKYLKEKLSYAYYSLSNSKEKWKYIQAKADLAEELASELISSDERYVAVATGRWTDKINQQLIEDVFAFKRNASFSSFGGINLKITTDGKTIKRNIQNADELLEISGSIQLESDRDYINLMRIKAFSVQVKSGIGQNILTNAKRNSVSLKQVGGLGGYGHPLYELYQQGLKEKKGWFKPYSKQKSKTLEAIGNYQLSKYIALTALSRNEVYFTEYGFMTTSQWLEKNKRYLCFGDPVSKLSTNMIEKKRAITFASI